MINQQTLCAARGEIISALYVDVRTRGQLDFDASMITNYSTRKRPKDDVTGQRFDPDFVRGREGRGFKTNSCPLPPNAFSLSRTSKAVNMLPPQFNSLALYAYADKCEWSHVEVVARHLWHQFSSAQKKPFRAKKEQTLRGMVFLAMQNWKHLLQTESDLHSPSRIRELLDISEHQWRRDWLPFWRQMHELLTETDHQVLSHVCRATSRKSQNDSKESAAA